MISKKIALILVIFVFILVSLVEEIWLLLINTGTTRLHKKLNKLCGRPLYDGTIDRLYYSTVLDIRMCKDEYLKEVREWGNRGGKDWVSDYLNGCNIIVDHISDYLVVYSFITFALYMIYVMLIILL